MEKYCEKIKIYLENIFTSLPQEENVLRMKNDMYCSMLDKFNNMIQNGINEDEAFGKVIGEFGSINEIRAALGIGMNSLESGCIPVSSERKKKYNKYKIIQGALISIGVAICLIAVLMYPLYASFFVDKASNAIFGLLIASAVFLFVFARTSEAKYFDVINPVKYAIPPTSERIAEYRKFLTARALLVSFAIFLFITSVFVIPLFDGMYAEFIIPLIMVAIGVAILIIIGTIHSTYADIRGNK